MNDDNLPLKRVFVALPASDTIADQIGALPRKGMDAKWTHPADTHITLRFLGDISEAAIEPAQERLRRIKIKPFHIAVKGLNHFENRQAVLWAGVESTRKLANLAAEVNETLQPLGFDMPVRPFVPHITIARTRRLPSLLTYREKYGHLIAGTWKATYFSLYLSGEPDETGRRYREIERYPFLFET